MLHSYLTFGQNLFKMKDLHLLNKENKNHAIFFWENLFQILIKLNKTLRLKKIQAIFSFWSG